LPTPALVALLPLVVAFSTTAFLVPQVRRFAVEWKLGDKPNGRKLHAQSIPHLGGVAIFGGFFLALLGMLATPYGTPHAARILALLPGLLVVFGLGLVDDLRGLRAGVKLVYQLVGAVCVVAMGGGLWSGALAAPLLLLAVASSVLWYVGVCNSVNLIDGLDGLAAGVAVIAAAAFLVVGLSVGDAAVVLVALGLIGALLAFLRSNFHPALIFMGDTGSMFLGFTLAFLVCLLAPRLGFWSAFLGGATVLGLPIVDTATAICRRLAAGRHIFAADGEHIHHKLLRLGLTHRRAVLLLYTLAVGFAVLGGGILLGHVRFFVLAVALGASVPLAITSLSQRLQSPSPAAKRPAAMRPVAPALAAGQPHAAAEALEGGEPRPASADKREREPQRVLAEIPPASPLR
jgi:UDP-GlcNAc:undecaprenyl-phosphate GlcNAc-1-phosphate transferase